MLHGDAFRASRGAGGVDDVDGVVRRYFRAVEVVHSGPGAGGQIDHGRDGRRAGESGWSEGHAGAGVLEDAGVAIDRLGGVQRDIGAPGLADGELRDEQGNITHSDQGHRIAGSHPGFQKAGGHGVGVCIELGEAVGPAGAVDDCYVLGVFDDLPGYQIVNGGEGGSGEPG